MPRPLRIEFAGAVYPVMSRGNFRQRIFQDEIGHLARARTHVSVGWLAESLGVRTRGGMGNGIWRVRQMLQTDKRLQKSWKVVCDNK